VWRCAGSPANGQYQSEISRVYLLIRHHTAVELVNRMSKLKVMSRSIDVADSRRVLVNLTKEGERRLQ
jgi:DNA-binding MarR family transcriptional regulator